MQRAIGVIDSGVGGLTVLNELVRQLPQEKFIYFGDTLRSPYGSKSKKEVQHYVFEVVEFLKTKNIKCLIIACNTATAYVYKKLKRVLSIPIIGVINPGARAAIKVTQNKNIGIIGTEGTINSGAYFKALTEIDPSVKVYPLACPTFVPMIEDGIIKGKQVQDTVSEALEPYKHTNIDTLILGCTHYPIIKESIYNWFDNRIRVVSSAEETTRETGKLLNMLHLLESDVAIKKPNHEFYTSGNLNQFVKLTKIIFQNEIDHIEKYEFQLNM